MLSLCERTGVSGCVIYNRDGQGRNTGSHQIFCRFSYSFQFNMRVGLGFPGGASGREPACQCRRYKRRGFNPWVRKILWSRKWQPTLVFLPGKSHG